MVLLVQKYGGSSLTDLSKLEIIARKIKKHRQAGYNIVVVLSALQGETDRLIGLADLVSSDCPKREYDALLATGEQIATCLMVMALARIGVKGRSFNARQAGIQTDGHHKRASITDIDCSRIHKVLEAGEIPVITGFQGMGVDDSITTLGRGGSDTTSVALAAKLKADECQIYVDVQGVFTADPKIEPKARLLHKVSIDQLLAYACLGGKVMQKRAVAIASRYRVPMRVCPTFIEGPGTMVDYDTKNSLEKTEVRAVAYAKNQVLLRITVAHTVQKDMQDLLRLMDKSGLEIEHTIKQSMRPQASSPGHYYLDCLLAAEDYSCFKEALDAWLLDKEPEDYRVIRNLAKVSLLGYGMTRNMEVTSKMMEIGEQLNITYYLLQGADQQISIVVEQQYLELVVRKLHEGFQLDRSHYKSSKSVAIVDATA